MFVKHGSRVAEEVPSLPGVYRYSPDRVVEELRRLESLGISNVLLYGIPKDKDVKGSSAYCEHNIVSETLRSIRQANIKLTIGTDICLCAYTSHGHCGVLKKGRMARDQGVTRKALAQMALSHAQAGADYVAPSAVLAQQVYAIRQVLDSHGYTKVRIMAYSAKFASNFYGPFRELANSKPRGEQKRWYQFDYTKTHVPLRAIERDIDEGADVVMVKPGIGYLDIVSAAKDRFKHPLAVYNVSGEYALVKQGAERGFWNEREMVYEITNSIKRAGADFIISYHTKDIAQWLKGNQ